MVSPDPVRVAEYFQKPYKDFIYVYNNVLSLEDVMSSSKPLHEIFESQETSGVQSIAMEIHRAIVHAMGGGVKGKDILDVGCKIGHFSILMAEYGAKVIGIDMEAFPLSVGTMMAWKRGLDKGPSSSEGSCYFIKFPAEMYAISMSSGDGIDLVLMLNVFDHMLRNSIDTAFETVMYFSRKSEHMAFMSGPHDDMDGLDIANEILERSEYRSLHTILENSYGGRNLYFFSKGY